MVWKFIHKSYMNKIEFLYNKDKYQGIDSSKALSHYGILGQKWGQRRWQNADGTFNEAGKERYFGPSGTTKKNKLENQKIGKYEGTPYRMNNGKMFHIDYQNSDGSLTKKGEKLLKRAQKHPKLFTTKNLIDEDYYDKWKNGENKINEENSNEEVQNRINEIKSSYKIDKNLSGDKITVKEFKDIIDELNNFNKGDFERNHREEYNKVADMGIDALNKAEGYDEHEVGDDGTRMWFMWEDQTDGLGEIAYLRSKGYSKDYVKQYLESPLPEEIEKIREKDHYATPFFVRNEFYRGGDDYIDALYEGTKQDKNTESSSSPKTAKDVKINWDIDESMKPYQNAINEEAQRILTDIITRNPGGAIPSSMSVKVGPDAKFTAEFSYDEEPKIGNIYDFGFKVQRNSRGGIIDKQGRKAFADAIKRNRDMVDAQNLTDDEVDEIVNNRIKATSNEDLLAQFNVQSLRYQMEKALNMKFGGNSKEDAKANKEAVKLLADLNDKDYTKRSEMLDKLYNGSQFEEQRNNVDKAIKEKFKDDFDELEKIYGGFDEVENEYLALAGLNRGLMDNGSKMEDISYMPRLYLYDDLNQGSLTGESIWAYDNGIEDSGERWSKMYNKENSTRDELVNSLTSDGSYNSKVLNGLDDGTKKDIVDHVYNYKSVPSSYWTLYNAGDTSKSEYDSVKDTTLKEAREISKKLSSSCGSDASGWALLNKAVNNLDLGGKDYTELTQADWDRINAEINSLKR